MIKNPRVFIIHGFEGTPNGGWRPWLMGQLASIDVYACALPMPSPYDPKKEDWVSEISRAVGTPSEEVFLVGHSLGVPATLQYLQSLPEGSKIGGAVLVSGPFRNVEDKFKVFLESFFHPEFDFDRIKKACAQFAVIHGDNDPLVPFHDAEEFSEALSSELIKIPNGGHLNGSSGWRELPAAFRALQNFLNNNAPHSSH